MAPLVPLACSAYPTSKGDGPPSQFWAPAQLLLFLTVLNYYRPMLILRNSSWSVADILALLGIGTAT